MLEIHKEQWDKVHRIWDIIDRLRGDSGCPWDRKQTPQTVQTYLIEEAHEAAAAARAAPPSEVAEELGDLLFMVLFVIHLYEEQGDFTLGDVAEKICTKMIRRHPHVFGTTTVSSAEQVKDNWQKIKAEEKDPGQSPMTGIPETLPALMRAYRFMSRRAYHEPQLNEADLQTREFIEKTRQVLARFGTEDPPPAKAFGELLLELVNLARIRKYRAEDCLHEWLRCCEPAPPVSEGT